MQPNFNDFAKGLGVDLNSNKPATPKFADTLRSVYQSSQQQAQPQVDNTNIADNYVNGIKGGVKQIDSGISDFASGMSQGGLEGMNKASAGALRAGAGAINTGFSATGIPAAIETVGNATGVNQAIGGGVNKIADFISNNPTLQKFAVNNPNLPDIIQSLSTLGQGALGIAAAPEAIKTVGDVAGKVGEAGSSALETAKGGVSNAIEGVTKKFAGKTAEEILATPESEITKLKPDELSFYKQNQNKALNAEYAPKLEQAKADYNTQQEAIQKAKQDSIGTATKAQQTAMEKSGKEISDLQTQMNQVASDKVESLRPKALQVLKKNSDTYASIIEKDLKPFADTKLSNKAIGDKIDLIFGDNPVKSAQMKESLGVSGDGEVTVQDVYNKMKSLRQGISRSGKGVFSQAEYDLNKSANGLSEVLADNGVDLSNANNFWKQWAPVRDEITSKIDPFNNLGTDTKKLGDMLTQKYTNPTSAVYNKNSLKTIETALGEPLDPEVKAVYEKLSSAQQKQADLEIAHELKLQSIKDEAAQATDKAQAVHEENMKNIKGEKVSDKADLTNEQYNAKRAIQNKQNIKNIVKTVLKVGAGALIGREFLR